MQRAGLGTAGLGLGACAGRGSEGDAVFLMCVCEREELTHRFLP